MRASDFLTELWTQPYELTSRATGPANREYYFDTKNNRSGRIVFDSFLDTDQGGTHVVLVMVHFYIDNLYHTSGKGDAVAIFSTVLAACRDYLRRYRPPVVVFETDDDKKRNLYVKLSGMFPDYVLYPNWRKDPVVGDEILDSLTDGVPADAVVLHRRDYVPEKTRVYVEDELRLYEFAPDGFEQFSLYVGDGVTRHFVERFNSVEAAQDEVEFLWDTDPETRLVVWMVTDSNDVVRWYYDPQELADQSRTQFRPPKN